MKSLHPNTIAIRQVLTLITISLIAFGMAGCSQKEKRPNSNVSGLWKVHLSDWPEPKMFAKLELIEEGGIISGTYTWEPYQFSLGTHEERTIALHGMRVGKDVELHWTFTETPGGDAISFEFEDSLKGTFDGNKMSGKYTFKQDSDSTRKMNELRLRAGLNSEYENKKDGLWIAERQ